MACVAENGGWRARRKLRCSSIGDHSEPTSEEAHVIYRLETRLLLAATLDGAGILTISGSAGADTIIVSLNAADFSVSSAPEGSSQTFPLTSINGIVVLAGDGNDTVTINEAVTYGVEVQGGLGNDT